MEEYGGMQGKYDLSGAGGRIGVLKGKKKQDSKRQFSTDSKKNYPEGHTDHYVERLETVPEVHRLIKAAFKDDVRFEDVMKAKATHQDNTGRIDESKKANDFNSPVDNHQTYHAGHVVGLGLKPFPDSKIKDQKALDELKVLLGKTNPVSKESNTQIERPIDRQIYRYLKENQDKKEIDVRESTRSIYNAVNESFEARKKLRTTKSLKANQYAQSRDQVLNSWSIHMPFFKNACSKFGSANSEQNLHG